jgi:uncharacterized flavoprotein (TIGR03862 family)
MMRVAIVGAGPAGLMAADVLSDAGVAVTLYDRMPSAGRKFLMAGRGGLNLTHSEPLDRFLARYATDTDWIARAIHDFPPQRLRDFAHDLGEDTFVGTSGRVFPKSFKASPLLRAWLARLRAKGVAIETRRKLVGFDGHRPVVADAAGATETPDVAACVLALGGGSWPRLGSDGRWFDMIRAIGADVAPLQPANCGLLVEWSPHFFTRHEGAVLKRVALSFGGRTQRGEMVVTRRGLEGSPAYALSGAVREALAGGGSVNVSVDLRPDLSLEAAAEKLVGGRESDSRANRLRKRLALSPVAIGLLNEAAMDRHREDPGLNPGDVAIQPRDSGLLPPDLTRGRNDALQSLATSVKSVSLAVHGVSGLDRAISSAGGVRSSAVDAHFMLRAAPGIFVAGEMLDFDAPTGGYLLQAAFATGHAAATGVLAFLNRPA